MTTTPDQPDTPDTPDQGDVDYIEDRDDQPPRELAQPEFDDQGDGGEAAQD